ncbi:MAG: bifunctional tRNA (5-methylaminomethyl-2-thiouridine)(34)-methyltransferase MnmD/FAD-dependent 5-carboxymethylaminomethyl-2-thiouridine(34) oxidoreductase MnmC [Gammaproteobacteria bacterium]|nr:bifunctional tRNA (5-methylaminomethyl-2-thiouridine)(34)-methyltransferase MnmD/FAD-dependent 5-carboxymethylaminomethyl-2-thiouridine(34) oxidoreductase MnmC [Gammaproteobacteria bacterium]
MKQADIHWENGEPVSRQFDDVYFSRSDGLAESEYVFLKQNQLPQLWQDQNTFVIAETGFGTGLNFLLTVKRWLQTQSSYNRLFYFAVEKYPLTKLDLQQALSAFPELSELSDEVIAAYPPALPGFHDLSLFDGQVKLCLIYGDADQQLAQMNARVDAWYLDGFAPSKNPEMWSASLFQQVARLSHESTRFSTFTAAGFVRRGLEQAGFEVERVKGFGQKREMLRGRLIQKADSTSEQPWFELPRKDITSKRVAVIGAGIAGVTTACALAQRGWQVELIDKHDDVAQEASGNPLGVVLPRISLEDSAEAEFYSTAYFSALRALNRLKQDDDQLQWYPGGVLQLSSSDRIEKQIAALEVAEEFARSVNAEQATELAGIAINTDALYFAQAGWLNPKQLCDRLLAKYKENIRWHKTSEVTDIRYIDGRWQTLDSSNEIISDTDSLVLCHGQSIKQFKQTGWLNIQPVRGQISYLPANDISGGLKTAICYDGYLLPEMNQQHVIGASFKPGQSSTEVRDEEHQQNMQSLNASLPDLFQTPQALQGRAAVRVVTPDRMPLLGALANIGFYSRHYADLQKGKPATQYPHAQHISGLYVNTGHGARGLTSSFLSAEIIAAQMNNEPLPVSNRVAHALNPARFIIRALKKGQTIHYEKNNNSDTDLPCHQCTGCL